MKRRKKDTLCWDCKNAIPSKARNCGCDWSKQFKPVENWKARPNRIASTRKGVYHDSYFVLDCPQFARG